METIFYGGPLDGQVKKWPGDKVPDEWEVPLLRHPGKRKMHYKRYAWENADKPDIFVAEGYDSGYHDGLHGELN